MRYDLSLSTTNGPAQAAFLRTLSRNCATDPRRNTFFGGCVSFNCAVILVTDVIERRHIETSTLPRQRQQSLFLGFVFQQRIDQFWPKNLAFADTDDVGELGDGLRVQKRRRSAHDNQSVVFRSVFRPHRDAAHLQHPRQVDIVSFEGDRKRDYIKVAQLGL